MSPPPLASPADAEGYGYTLPSASAYQWLARASVRVRRAAEQPITPSTVTLRLVAESEELQLPAPPVIEVLSVMAVAGDGTTAALTGWWWDGTGLHLPGHCRGAVEVTYRRGWAVIPDGVVELVCQVAHRLANTPLGMDIGIRSESKVIDDYQTATTYAAEQVQVSGDLLPGELTALKRELGCARAVWVVSADG